MCFDFLRAEQSGSAELQIRQHYDEVRKRLEADQQKALTELETKRDEQLRLIDKVNKSQAYCKPSPCTSL